MTQPNPEQQQPQQQPSEGGQPQQQPQQQPPADGGQQQQDLDTPKFSQKWVNDFEARTRREYTQKAERDKELIEKGKKFEQQEQEQQPLSERVSTLSAESAQKDTTIASKDLQITRMQLAWDAGLPPAIGRRVQGNTEDEIKADIEYLKGELTAQGVTTPPVGGGLRPNPQQGAPSSNNDRASSADAGRDLWNKRHGQKTNAAT